LEIVESSDEVCFGNEETTIIDILVVRDLASVKISPFGIIIVPRSSVNILSPWVSNVIESDNSVSKSILDFVVSKECVCVASW
jgi:hypothetical protein